MTSSAHEPNGWTVADELRAVVIEQHEALMAVRPLVLQTSQIGYPPDVRSSYSRLLDQVDGAIASGQEWL